MIRLLLPAVVALVLAGGVVACSGASPAEPQPSPTPTPTPSVTAPGPREVLAGASIGDPTSGPPAHEAKVVYVGPRDVKAVALTFDTGVGSAHMPEVLDILKKHGKLATFGVTGEWAATNPDLLKRIIAEGHAIVDHSWSHASFTGEDTETPPLSDDQIRDELRRTEEKILEIAGVSTKPYFRPPYGDYDSRVNKIAFEEGYEYNVLWYVDGMGWDGRSTRHVVNVTLANAFNGAIFLYHTDNPYEYKALEEIIEGLEERDFQLLTIPQLLGHQPTPTPTPTPIPTEVPAPPPPVAPTPLPTPTPAPSPMPSPVYTRLAFDDFESGGRSGGSGWLGPWQTSDPFVTTSCIPHSGGFCLDLSLGGFYQRAVNLSGRRNVHLRFWARLSDLEPGRTALVAVLAAGGQLQVVKEFTAAEGDGEYRPYDIDLSGVPMSSDFSVVFESQLAVLRSRWHLDDVELVTVTP
jgi:peptidoglycan/xylan/chitin deacetylase (PgdA/CDA1 family)